MPEPEPGPWYHLFFGDTCGERSAKSGYRQSKQP